MVKENAVLMAEARASLTGKWGLAVGTFVVYILIAIVLQLIPVAGAFASLLISGPFILGISFFSLSIARGEEARMDQLFDGFKDLRSMITYLLMVLFVFLWMLLLIVPGIIMAIAYSQAFFILAEDESINPMDALRKSKEMMYGYKWKYFCLGLRFLGWALLCILTFGIGFLWLYPYIYVTYANFYDDIKEHRITA